jgi:hypothetical protein
MAFISDNMSLTNGTHFASANNNNDSVGTIVFGVINTLLTVLAITISWLQLRRMP